MASIEAWPGLPSRVVEQTRWILEILAQHRTTCTFFVLGWVAARHPDLIREIAEAGHEIGCHSYAHQLVYNQDPDDFRTDLQLAVKTIEDACGITPRVYRAPSYSVTAKSMWALPILVEAGFTHDSSIYPIHHDRYGMPGFSRFAQTIHTEAGPICEVPSATARVSKETLAPVGGGGYMRLLPYWYTAAGIRRINQDDKRPACIYVHPWELDPDTPRLAQGRISRLRTYTGLGTMRRKFIRLLREFSFSTVTEVYPNIETEGAAQARGPVAALVNSPSVFATDISPRSAITFD